MNVTIDPKDQKRLEDLARESGKDPGELLRQLVHAALAGNGQNGDAGEGSEHKEVPPELSLAGLAGIGKGLWAGEDSQEYVNKLRNEWQ